MSDNIDDDLVEKYVINFSAFNYKIILYIKNMEGDDQILNVYLIWKQGNLSAKEANKMLTDNHINEFANKIENGFFIDPVSLEPFKSADKKMSSLLIGKRICEPDTVRKMIDDKLEELHRELEGFDLHDITEVDFIDLLKDKIIDPSTRQYIPVGKLKELYQLLYKNKSGGRKTKRKRKSKRKRRTKRKRRYTKRKKTKIYRKH